MERGASQFLGVLAAQALLAAVMVFEVCGVHVLAPMHGWCFLALAVALIAAVAYVAETVLSIATGQPLARARKAWLGLQIQTAVGYASFYLLLYGITRGAPVQLFSERTGLLRLPAELEAGSETGLLGEARQFRFAWMVTLLTGCVLAATLAARAGVLYRTTAEQRREVLSL